MLTKVVIHIVRTQKFPKNSQGNFDTHAYMCVSEGEKY